jgi:hypothetical protein
MNGVEGKLGTSYEKDMIILYHDTGCVYRCENNELRAHPYVQVAM